MASDGAYPPGSTGPPPGYEAQQQPQTQSSYVQPQQQAYGQPMQPMQAQPGVTSTNVMVIQQNPVIRPSSYLALSIFVLICCNLILGIIALIFSIMSQSAADSGDLEDARSKGKIAMWLNVAGIVITIVIVIVVPVIVITTAAAAVATVLSN